MDPSFLGCGPHSSVNGIEVYLLLEPVPPGVCQGLPDFREKLPQQARLFVLGAKIGQRGFHLFHGAAVNLGDAGDVYS